MGKLGRRVRRLLVELYNDAAGDGDEGYGRIFETDVRPPWVPLTIYINMNHLVSQSVII